MFPCILTSALTGLRSQRLSRTTLRYRLTTCLLLPVRFSRPTLTTDRTRLVSRSQWEMSQYCVDVFDQAEANSGVVLMLSQRRKHLTIINPISLIDMFVIIEDIHRL